MVAKVIKKFAKFVPQVDHIIASCMSFTPLLNIIVVDSFLLFRFSFFGFPYIVVWVIFNNASVFENAWAVSLRRSMICTMIRGFPIDVNNFRFTTWKPLNSNDDTIQPLYSSRKSFPVLLQTQSTWALRIIQPYSITFLQAVFRRLFIAVCFHTIVNEIENFIGETVHSSNVHTNYWCIRWARKACHLINQIKYDRANDVFYRTTF